MPLFDNMRLPTKMCDAKYGIEGERDPWLDTAAPLTTRGHCFLGDGEAFVSSSLPFTHDAAAWGLNLARLEQIQQTEHGSTYQRPSEPDNFGFDEQSSGPFNFNGLGSFETQWPTYYSASESGTMSTADTMFTTPSPAPTLSDEAAYWVEYGPAVPTQGMRPADLHYWLNPMYMPLPADGNHAACYGSSMDVSSVQYGPICTIPSTGNEGVTTWPTAPAEPEVVGRRKISSTKPSQLGKPAPKRGEDVNLLEWKKSGFSYKEIRVLGRYQEAESTLRGRYRTLTKPKVKRVRRPVWTGIDVYLLKEYVHHFAGPPSKISWKKVSEYIETHGGSYKFGVATCKKKWETLRGL